jgi:hypothetical protein
MKTKIRLKRDNLCAINRTNLPIPLKTTAAAGIDKGRLLRSISKRDSGCGAVGDSHCFWMKRFLDLNEDASSHSGNYGFRKTSVFF